MANRIEHRTDSKFGIHFWSSEGNFSPKKKDMLLRWVWVYCSSSVRCAVYVGHRKRTWSSWPAACLAKPLLCGGDQWLIM